MYMAMENAKNCIVGILPMKSTSIGTNPNPVSAVNKKSQCYNCQYGHQAKDYSHPQQNPPPAYPKAAKSPTAPNSPLIPKSESSSKKCTYGFKGDASVNSKFFFETTTIWWFRIYSWCYLWEVWKWWSQRVPMLKISGAKIKFDSTFLSSVPSTPRATPG